MTIKLIVAVDEENGIWKDGKLAWNIVKDMKHFKNTTIWNWKNAVIMGRKTWESLPEKYKPLWERINVILSRAFVEGKKEWQIYKYWSLIQAIEAVKTQNEIEDIFIIWGAEIYNLALEQMLVQELYITHVMWNFSCDTFLDFQKNEQDIEYGQQKFILTQQSEIYTTKKWIDFQCNIYKKRIQ